MGRVSNNGMSGWTDLAGSSGAATRFPPFDDERLFSAIPIGGDAAYEVTIPEGSVNLVFLASAVRERRLPVPPQLRPLFVKGRVYLRTAEGFFKLCSARSLVGFLCLTSQRYEYIGQSALVRLAAVRGHTLRAPDKCVMYGFVDPQAGVRVVEKLLVARREVGRWKEMLGVCRNRSAESAFQ